MSYADYFTLVNLAADMHTGKISFGKAVELAEMCLGVKLTESSHDFLRDMKQSYISMEESAIPSQEYLRRAAAILDFETKFGICAERDAPSGKLNI